ncbi:hypothetical protein L0U88_15130 [Flavihumibacter sp. RY-1]|uniref:Uncharacterized protein n=1 Tax=Flavihumibacter fluminis TaxID=2909236 RepID=A0ABS9BLJ1_9BACT|nr:hypothetical protein [Flavihumibacter fluminis]MCF1715972.1 hypothetical protein [Flavihumibacter fluminis]
MLPKVTATIEKLIIAAIALIYFSFSFLTILIMVNTSPSIILNKRHIIVIARKAGLFEFILIIAVMFAIKMKKIEVVAIEKPKAILENFGDFLFSEGSYSTNKLFIWWILSC